MQVDEIAMCSGLKSFFNWNESSKTINEHVIYDRQNSGNISFIKNIQFFLQFYYDMLNLFDRYPFLLLGGK